MKGIILLSAFVLAVGCSHSGGAGASSSGQTQAAQDEAALAAALKGRVAGPVQECVAEPELGSTTSYGRGVIVFTTRTGDVAYVNRPISACPEVTSGRALQNLTRQTRFCRGDAVTVFDPVTRMSAGSCTLGDFTPYRRAP